MKYVALLRGIGPGNPNMQNDKLRSVFENLGYDNVHSVISSGNILFETDNIDTEKLENDIQASLQATLGIHGGTIVRDEEALKHLLSLRIFSDANHSVANYLTITFLKHNSARIVDLPYDSGKGFKILHHDNSSNAVYAATDTTIGKTPNLMQWLEKQYGRDITTRTFKTIERIVAKF